MASTPVSLYPRSFFGGCVGSLYEKRKEACLSTSSCKKFVTNASVFLASLPTGLLALIESVGRFGISIFTYVIAELALHWTQKAKEFHNTYFANSLLIGGQAFFLALKTLFCAGTCAKDKNVAPPPSSSTALTTQTATGNLLPLSRTHPPTTVPPVPTSTDDPADLGLHIKIKPAPKKPSLKTGDDAKLPPNLRPFRPPLPVGTDTPKNKNGPTLLPKQGRRVRIVLPSETPVVDPAQGSSRPNKPPAASPLPLVSPVIPPASSMPMRTG